MQIPSGTTEVSQEFDSSGLLPKTRCLYQNHPNPFNPTTAIPFTVYGSQSMVHSSIRTTLEIYNIRGELVRTLINESRRPGRYEIVWNGKDDDGNQVASGVYFYQLKTDDYRQTKKMLLVR
jgi:flagellar hook assembly protein FlgD